MSMKIRNCVKRYGYVPMTCGVTALAAFPSYAAGESLTGTLSIFTEVFQWFLKEGANLLTWMLDKPIILLSLSIFFVGAVVGMLSRIYNAF